MKISDLKPYMKKVNLNFKVIELTEIRSVKSMLDQIEHKVCEAKIADDSGAVYLTLWDKAIEEIQIQKTYSLENGFTSEFKKSLRVNIGRFGKIQEIQETIKPNTEKMFSAEIISKPKQSIPEVKDEVKENEDKSDSTESVLEKEAHPENCECETCTAKKAKELI
jgi:replication factor A1